MFIRERDSQGQLFCDQINAVQLQRELLQKTAEHEKQRLGGFNFVFEFEVLLKRLRRPNQFKHPIGFPVRALPHSDSFRTESRRELLFIKGSELTKRMNPPLVQDYEDFLQLDLPFHGGNLQQVPAYVQVNSFTVNHNCSGGLKARNSLAQGKALGDVIPMILCPEGALQMGVVLFYPFRANVFPLIVPRALP